MTQRSFISTNKIRCKLARVSRLRNRIEASCLPQAVHVVSPLSVPAWLARPQRTLLLEGLSAEIVLIDKTQSLAEGHADDLRDAQLYSRTARVFVGDFSDCATADIIILTAGVNQALMGNSRINDTNAAAKIVRDIVDEIRRYDPCGVILVASNPLDVITYAVGKWSGLPQIRIAYHALSPTARPALRHRA